MLKKKAIGYIILNGTFERNTWIENVGIQNINFYSQIFRNILSKICKCDRNFHYFSGLRMFIP